jgi:predicted SAM-dependent methyltransferase
MRIDIAGGNEPRAGYINVDRFAIENGVQADCLWLPFADRSVDAVSTSHYLEHLGKYQVVPQLKEVHRVLRFGGELHIEVPSLEWCCKNWLNYLDNGWNMDALFGDQSTPFQFHKTGFTRNILLSYLGAAGFSGQVILSETWSHEQACIVADLTK